MLNMLNERKEAARAWAVSVVEEALDGFQRGEWATLVKAHDRVLNGQDMDL